MSAVNDPPRAPKDLAAVGRLAADVVIGPVTIDGSIGLYPRELGELADELRKQHVTVAFQHDAGDRQWTDSRGPVADLVLEAVIGLAGSAALEAVRHVLSQLRTSTGRGRQVNVEVRMADGRRLELQGTAQDVAEALGRLDNVDGGANASKAQP